MFGVGGVSANIVMFEPYIKESEETQGGKVVILREGWLLKRSSNMRKEWKRRYFVLDSLGMLYYYSNKVLGLPPWPSSALMLSHLASPELVIIEACAVPSYFFLISLCFVLLLLL